MSAENTLKPQPKSEVKADAGLAKANQGKVSRKTSRVRLDGIGAVHDVQEQPVEPASRTLRGQVLSTLDAEKAAAANAFAIEYPKAVAEVFDFMGDFAQEYNRQVAGAYQAQLDAEVAALTEG
ncbi:MAG: hypothetical protein AAF329_00430 [Cyanobacteria bacterium P01_A01_bin.17]